MSVFKGCADSLHSKCRVEEHEPNRVIGFSGKEWDALWDTGATCSVITPAIVKVLDLSPVSYTFMSGVSGIELAAQYYIDLELPGGVIAGKVLAVEGAPLGCDLLIGMDIIALGDFMVSCCNGTTHFGSRTPSVVSKEEMVGIIRPVQSSR
jgi:hypothetical protein